MNDSEWLRWISDSMKQDQNFLDQQMLGSLKIPNIQLKNAGISAQQELNQVIMERGAADQEIAQFLRNPFLMGVSQ